MLAEAKNYTRLLQTQKRTHTKAFSLCVKCLCVSPFYFSCILTIELIKNLYLCAILPKRQMFFAEAPRVGNIYGKAFTNACSWRWETSQLSIAVKGQSYGRCLVDVYSSTCDVRHLAGGVHLWVYCTYRRGLLRCSFWRQWAMRRPLSIGRVTVQRPTLFRKNKLNNTTFLMNCPNGVNGRIKWHICCSTLSPFYCSSRQFAYCITAFLPVCQGRETYYCSLQAIIFIWIGNLRMLYYCWQAP